MRALLLQLGVFAAIQVLIAAVLVSAYELDDNAYFAATLDKHARAEAEPAGRVLFAGGSNLSFGMDSPRVADALERPVINLSLHAALGLTFMLREAEDVARPGDVVVLSLEYQHFAGDLASDYLFGVLEQRPASVAYLGWRELPVLLDTAAAYFGQVMRRAVRCLSGRSYYVAEPPYDRASFNASGDVVGHYDMPRTANGGKSAVRRDWRPTACDEVVAELNDFDEAMRRRDVRVVYTYPAISRAAYESAAAALVGLHDKLTERCTIPILDTPHSATLSRDLFFDTAYHLGREGVERRAERLIPLLREQLR